jgi:hypothetical protein
MEANALSCTLMAAVATLAAAPAPTPKGLEVS